MLLASFAFLGKPREVAGMFRHSGQASSHHRQSCYITMRNCMTCASLKMSQASFKLYDVTGKLCDDVGKLDVTGKLCDDEGKLDFTGELHVMAAWHQVPQ